MIQTPLVSTLCLLCHYKHACCSITNMHHMHVILLEMCRACMMLVHSQYVGHASSFFISFCRNRHRTYLCQPIDPPTGDLYSGTAVAAHKSFISRFPRVYAILTIFLAHLTLPYTKSYLVTKIYLLVLQS